MQKVFNGHQSGIFALTLKTIREALPDVPLHLSVTGVHASSRTPLDLPLQGACVGVTFDGYVRNVLIRTPSGRQYTVGCNHAVEEDIAADSVRITYFPALDFAQVSKRFPLETDIPELTGALTDAILTLDNSDRKHLRDLSRYLARRSHLIRNKSPGIRRLLVLLAKQAPTLTEAGPLITAGLTDPDDEVRAAALVDLAAYKAVLATTPVERILLRLLASPDRSVRAYACEDLGFYGTRRVLQPLLQLLHDPDEHVREAAFVSFYEILARRSFKIDAGIKREILRFTHHALGEKGRYVLNVAALRLGMLVAPQNHALASELLRRLKEPLDLSATDAPFTIQLFYRTTLFSLLGIYAYIFGRRADTRVELRETMHAITEEIRALYESQRKLNWSYYMGAYMPPVPKKKGRVFVNFAHTSKAFESALKDLQPALKKARIELFISKDANPFWSENVFIPKIYRPIQESELMLVDISRHNLNVGYELGLAEKLSVPTVIVVSKNTPDSIFDLAGHYVRFVYDETDPENMARFKSDLLSHLEQVFEGGLHG